jgi:hypothetical protein
LANDKPKRIRYGGCLNAELNHPIRHIETPSGMHRADDEMTGESRVKRRPCTDPVADLTERDDIGILPEYRLKCRGVIESDLFVEGCLTNPNDLLLYRILNGNDAAATPG